MGVAAISPRPSEIANARLLIEALIGDILRWEAQLLEASRLGNDAASERLADLILRSQRAIGQQIAFLTGTDPARLSRAMGVGL